MNMMILGDIALRVVKTVESSVMKLFEHLGGLYTDHHFGPG